MLNDALYIICGIPVTLLYTFSAVAIGICFGVPLALLRFSGHCKFAVDAFVSIFRGTPLLLQLSFFYFVVPNLLGVRWTAVEAGVLAFGLNSTAYIIEIVRAGIQSVDQGQFNAAKVLGIPTFLMWKDIILPQALKNILPSLMNELITVLKETALISVLGEVDIMRRAQFVAAEKYNYFGPICIAGACYYLQVLVLEYLAKFVERKISNA